MPWTLLAPAVAAVSSAVEFARAVRSYRRGEADDRAILYGIGGASAWLFAGFIAAANPVLAGLFIVATLILDVRAARHRRRLLRQEAGEAPDGETLKLKEGDAPASPPASG